MAQQTPQGIDPVDYALARILSERSLRRQGADVALVDLVWRKALPAARRLRKEMEAA